MHCTTILLILYCSSFYSVGVAATGENPFTPRGYLIRYWNKQISNELPKPDFLLNKGSPLTAAQYATFLKLASDQNSLSDYLPEFCSKADLLCFPDLAPSLKSHSSPPIFNTYKDGNFNSYRSDNFTTYSTGGHGRQDSFNSYNEGTTLDNKANTFQSYSRDSTTHNDSFTAYATHSDYWLEQSFNAYGTNSTGGEGDFNSYQTESNILDLQFNSYSDHTDEREQKFTEYTTNSTGGNQSFTNYGDESKSLLNDFTHYGQRSTEIFSTFNHYRENAGGGNDSFSSYGTGTTAPENVFNSYGENANGGNDSFILYGNDTTDPVDSFRNYGNGGSDAVQTFKEYVNHATQSDENFQSYGRNAKGGEVGFDNYGVIKGTGKFSAYGQGNTGTTVDFKIYGNYTFKEYIRQGVTFSSYTESSSLGPSMAAKGKMGVSKWAVEPGKFFREEMLKSGTTMSMPNIHDKMPKRSFLPRGIVSKLPFSSSKLGEMKKFFHANKDSSMYKMFKDALADCEREPSPGETKQCPASIEDMIDFATSVLGRNVVVRTTENIQGSKGNIMIGEVKGINGGNVTKSVSCHQVLYSYLLYYCHSVPKVRVYEADILDPKSKVKINNGVAICHLDTSSWSSSHAAFVSLGSRPGKIEVCHWIFENDMTWTTAD